MDSTLKDEIKRILIENVETKLESSDLSKKSGNPFVGIIFGELTIKMQNTVG